MVPPINFLQFKVVCCLGLQCTDFKLGAQSAVDISYNIGRRRATALWAQRRQSSFGSISKGCARRGRKADFAENSPSKKFGRNQLKLDSYRPLYPMNLCILFREKGDLRSTLLDI